MQLGKFDKFSKFTRYQITIYINNEISHPLLIKRIDMLNAENIFDATYDIVLLT